MARATIDDDIQFIRLFILNSNNGVLKVTPRSCGYSEGGNMLSHNIKFTIHGDPRTKKNSEIIAGSGGRCPVCGKFKKQWIKQSSAHDAWAVAARFDVRAAMILNERARTLFPIAEPVNVKAVFYMRTRRKVDLLNLLAAVDDLLVDCGVLEDDNVRVVAAHDGSRVFYDKDNPRIEIEIERIKKEG